MLEENDGWMIYGELVVRPFETLEPPQQLLVALGELRNEVNNGGFDQYFFRA